MLLVEALHLLHVPKRPLFYLITIIHHFQLLLRHVCVNVGCFSTRNYV